MFRIEQALRFFRDAVNYYLLSTDIPDDLAGRNLDKRAMDNANRTINGRDTLKMIARSFAHNRDAAAHAALRTICSVRGRTCGGIAGDLGVVHFAPIQHDLKSGLVVWVKPVVLFSV
jgi:hypothetical protein